MTFLNKVTAVLVNYNGYRNNIGGRGRLQITLDSLLHSLPFAKHLSFLLIDNESSDGSKEMFFRFPYGEKITFKRLVSGNGWFPTTQNNCFNIRRISHIVQTSYIWFIENDSYFFNKNFLEKAINVLDERRDISIVHLRRFTPLCCLERPGAPQNHCRVKSVERLRSGQKFYILEKTENDCNWVDVGNGLPKNFVPQKEYNFINLCLGNRPGDIRQKEDGSWQRYIWDYWTTYTNHGYVARTKDLRFVMDNYRPASEREIAQGFKKHFWAARLDEDAFVCFGWKGRVNPTEREALAMFRWAENKRSSSVDDYGTFRK